MSESIRRAAGKSAGILLNFRGNCGADRQCRGMGARETDRHERFQGLYLQHEGALRSFLRTLLPVPSDATEVMQNVAIVLWRKFEDLGASSEFRRWAFGVARLEALQFRRMKARDRHVFDEGLLQLLASEAEQDADLLAAEREALSECLQKLESSQRLLITATYGDGARLDEYAKRSGRTAMSVYKAIHRIRMRLLDCVRHRVIRRADR